MPYTLEYQEQDGLLRVISVGEMTNYDELTARVDAFLLKAYDLGVNRVLLDNTQLIFSVNSHDITRLVQYMAARDVQFTGIRVASVSKGGGFKGLKANEAIYRNRSLNYMVFESEQEALDWLAS